MTKREESSKFYRNKLKYKVDEKFFDKWTSQMAYLLGFTYADGNIYKTSLAWDIQTRDVDLLLKIKKALATDYPIYNRKNSVRLRINNQILVNGAIKRGLLPKKNLRHKLPEMPNKFLRHFIRGYLEGDGWVVLRTGRNEGDIGFVSGNREFIEYLCRTINYKLKVSGAVREKVKVTPKGVVSKTYLLEYYSANAFKIANWVYTGIRENDLFLDRKHGKYLEMKKLYDYLNSGTKKVRVVQRRFDRSIKEILEDLSLEQKLDSVMIAEILGVHHSSIYRWLAQTGVK
jgi:hypothetical protein